MPPKPLGRHQKRRAESDQDGKRGDGPAAPQMMSIFMQRSFSELHLADVAETQAAVTFLVCLVAGAVYTAIVFRDSAAKGTLAA